MAGLELKLNFKGLQPFQRTLKRAQGELGGGGGNFRRRLHQRWGILTLQWIDRNFSQEGALTRAPWRKLSVNNSTVRLLSEYLTQRVENPALLSRF